MEEEINVSARRGPFYLRKWFLDFVSDTGETMIFYAARLNWHGWPVPYTSWLHYAPNEGVRMKSRFHHASMPEKKNHQITWTDERLGISGTWTEMADPIEARILDTEEGYLDWSCLQPASDVTLMINNTKLIGRGYVERLELTMPPWKIPMDELRWGRFGSAHHNIVWIELHEKEKQQWVWWNGERQDSCTIADDHLSIPAKNLLLTLDRSVSLESEKKIFSVVNNLIRFIPGIQRAMPVKFMMADESKWMSKGQLLQHDKVITDGMAIHELVNFNPFLP